MKLKTVASVALGMEVLAEASGRDADQWAPSFVFDLKLGLVHEYLRLDKRMRTQIGLEHGRNARR